MQRASDEIVSGSEMVRVTWSVTSDRLNADSGFWLPEMMIDFFP